MISRAYQELLRCLPLTARGLALVWRAARPWTVAWGGLIVVQGLLPAALVWLTRTTVNLLAAALAATDILPAFSGAWPYLGAIAALLVAAQLLASVTTWVRSVQAELVQDHIHGLIHAHALRQDLAFFERPDSYDLLYRASVDAAGRPVILLENLGAFLQNALTLGALALLLAAYTPWLPLLLVGSAVPGLWIVGRFILREVRWRRENTVNERRLRYYDWMMTEKESAAELRLFALGGRYREAWAQLRQELRAGRLRLAGSELRAELLAAVLSWGGALAGMLWMLRRAAHGLAQLGDLVLCYQAFQQGQALLRSLLESSGQIYRSILFLDNLFQFLEIEPQLKDPPAPRPLPAPLRQGIRFEGVGFRYPGTGRDALHDFTLELPAGKVTAVVGPNGAGKSTLVKLLCRFYDPDRGRVLVDGVDLRELQREALWRQISVLFQEPLHVHASAAENIALGDPAADAGRIAAAAAAAGADACIARLPQGYHTVLGQWFGGAELSVGEWQRLALARAFLRDAPVIVLDEPTSAMDSWAEADWLARFRELTAGRTALMITHRFTTAMHADVIHVMRAGKVTESGTHAELVAAGGLYAASWERQMQEVARSEGER